MKTNSSLSTAESIREWLILRLADLRGIDPKAIDARERFSRYGLDSMGARGLIAELGAALERELPVTLVWEHPTPEALARYLIEGDSAAPGAAPVYRRSDEEPIAVIGVACRFPSAPSADAYWRLLRDGVDAIAEVPRSRWDLEALFDPDPSVPGKVSTRWAGLLDKLDEFDPLFFGISPREAVQMDPQQRVMLELSWEALEDAGVVPESLQGARAGVFFGAMWADYSKLCAGALDHISSHTATGVDLSIIPARVSYSLGLRGPSLAINTACSSSLVAVHLACDSLRKGESTLALAGGVNLLLTPDSFVALSKFGAMAPDGRSKAFDARANGYVRAEGAGVVVLRPLSVALANGDPIYCLIRGSAMNNDGFSNGLTAPSPQAQEAVLRDAYADAGVTPSDVHYVEAHGTGTFLGDPIEAKSLGVVLGRGRPAERPLRLGSVKTNIGHTEAAAGIAGLIKVALAMKHRRLPRSLNFESPNPNIPFEELHIDVQRSIEDWPEPARSALAGVSSFGFGGTNCHVALESLGASPAQLIALSAPTDEALAAAARELRAVAERGGPRPALADLCAAAGARWAFGEHRLSLTVRSYGELAERLRAWLEGGGKAGAGIAAGRAVALRRRIVYVFAGGGSHWVGMGRRLLAEEPVFRATIERCSEAMRPYLPWSLLDELSARETQLLEEHVFVQPAIFAMQVSLAALWASWGVTPDAVVGQSMGEVAAACVAGALSIEDASRLVCVRSQLVKEKSVRGAMAAVELALEDAERALAGREDRLSIAVSASPTSTVIAGDIEAMEEVLAELTEQRVFCRRIRVDYASHSPHMDALRDDLLEVLRWLRPRSTDVPFYSTVTASIVDGAQLDGAYWVRNVREPVLFASAVDRLLEEGHDVFIDMNPHPLLAHPIEQCVARSRSARAATVLASMRRDEPERGVLLDSLGALHALGVSIGWDRLYPGPAEPVDLPAVEAICGGAAPATSRDDVELLVLSGHRPEALRDAATALAGWIAERRDLPLRDVCYTASVRRTHHKHRLAAVASSREVLSAALTAFAGGDTRMGINEGQADGRRKVVFVFPGQGAQWAGMGRRLMAQEPVFLAALEACDRAIRQHAGWSLLERLRSGGDELLSEVDVIQPALFAIGVALAALWRSWGVEPDAVVGHSMGEVAAAHVAGALSLDDAARIICRRSQLFRPYQARGAMAHVELPFSEAEKVLRGYEDRLSVAVVNSSRSTVLSGDVGALEEVLSRLTQENIFCRRLNINFAAHSPQMDPLQGELRSALVLGALAPTDAAVPICSTVTGELIDGSALDPEYWATNLRAPVLFSRAVQRLVESDHAVFVEMSAHPTLLPALEEGLRDAAKEGVALPSLRRDQEERRVLLESLGALYARGCEVDWERLYLAGSRCVPLPAYPWQRERYWIESETRGASKRLQSAGGAEDHPLLGAPFTAVTEPEVHYWQQEIGVEALPYLADHRVQGVAVLPGAAYVEMGLAASAQLHGAGAYALERVAFERMLAFPSNSARSVQTILTQEGPGRASFQVFSRDDDGARWALHAKGDLRATAAPAGPVGERELPEAVQHRCATVLSAGEHYERAARRGIDYGARFRGLELLWSGDGEVLGRVCLRDDIASDAGAYQVHPALLDACLQALLGLIPGESAPSSGHSTFVPVSVARAWARGRPGGALWVHGRLRASDDAGADTFAADALVTTSDGEIVAELGGIRFQRLDPGASEQARAQEKWLYAVAWRRKDVLPEAPARAAGARLVLMDRGGTGAALASLLKSRGDRVVRVVAGARYAQIEPDLYEVDPADAAAYRALLRDAFGSEQLCGEIVHLFGLDSTEVSMTTAETLSADQRLGTLSALHLAQAVLQRGWRDTPRLWLVTRGAQPVNGDAGALSVSQSAMWGFGRTLALEHPKLRCARVDLGAGMTAAEAPLLFRELDSSDGEDEIALRSDGRYVARLARTSLDAKGASAALGQPEPAGDRPVRLGIEEPGVIERLALRAASRRAPARGEVEIEVEATGLNFLDVLLSLGVIPDDAPGAGGGGPRLGLEFAGRIAAIGEGVDGLAIGQEVFGLGPSALSSYVTTPAALVAPKPAHLSFEEAAAAPIAFLTAIHALSHVGRLRRGERVLIHAGAGGVGMAAVQWAQHVGAEVFATAGSEEKRALLRSLGVERAFDSRSLRFADDVMRATNNEGVDVVLNSLSGEFIAASLGVLRDYGRFVEIGKRDYYANNPIGLRPFLRSISFSLVDLRRMMVDQTDVVSSLLAQLVGMLEARSLRALPTRVFPVSRAADAFSCMAKGQHIGKIAVAMRDPEARVVSPARKRVRADGSYLLTGGLGGLGLSVAQWLVAQGARYLVLVGRSGPSEPSRDVVRAMQDAGAEVLALQADVSRPADVARVLSELDRRMPPLCGVVHAAAVLDDRTTLELDAERFDHVMAAKALGAWNLHEQTRERPLDFFVLYSSATSLLGSPGQGNYTAANAVVDALSHYRRASGLPALSINWGVFTEVGMAAAQQIRGERLSSRGFGSLSPAQGVEMLGRLIDGDLSQVGVLDLDVRTFIEFNPTAGGASLLSELAREATRARGNGASVSRLVDGLAAADASARRSMLEQHIVEQLGRILQLDAARIDPLASFRSLGVDSLMSLELRNRLEASLGLKLSATLLFAYPTVQPLAEHLLGQLALSEPRDAHADDRSSRERSSAVGATQPARGGAERSLPEAPAGSTAAAPPTPLLAGARVEPPRPVDEPIAIIGMSCRFPKAPNPKAFWRVLREGVDAIRETPRERWNADALFDPDPSKPGTAISRWGGFLDQIDGFDPGFFGISPRETVQMDPQQRLMLELSWEALEDAGLVADALKDSLTAVFVGVAWSDYAILVHRGGLEAMAVNTVTGYQHSIVANRVSYAFGLQGPSVSLDTACSSSLVAVHLACESLRRGESTVALAGGVNLSIIPESTVGISKFGGLSPDGRCFTFDARANGFVRGEGGGVVVLKPLSRALADGDPIYCVIRGSAVNNDGASNGLTAPNPVAQERVLRAAYARGGVDAASVDYVEAHGTGTLLGDPIEAKALGEVLGAGRPPQRPLRVGSVKTNIGHLEAAAGVAGLIKLALCLKHRELPPSLHFDTPNPNIPFADLHLEVQRTLMPWPESGKPRTAGVSSFGFGGTNCHIVVEERPSSPERDAVSPEERAIAAPQPPYVVPLSAHRPEALAALAEAYRDLLADGAFDDPERLRDLAYTASVRRAHHEHRLALVGSTREELGEALELFVSGEIDPGQGWGDAQPGRRRQVVFVFSGQGSQWVGMGRELLGKEPVFREAMSACAALVQRYAGFSLLDELVAPEEASRLHETALAQPAIFAVQVALSALWASWSVKPDAVVGHSVGEVAAAHVAGALTLEQAVRLVCARGRVMQRATGLGKMAAVQMTAEAAAEVLREMPEARDIEARVCIAAINDPGSVVLSGGAEALDEVLERLKERDVHCRPLRVDYAFHSPQMAPLADELASALGELAPPRTQIAMYSTVTGARVSGEDLDAAYWARNVRQPVLFAPAIEAAIADGHRMFLEVGPHPVLKDNLQHCLASRGEEGRVLFSLRRRNHERRTLLSQLGALYANGFAVDWKLVYPSRGRCVALPTYPWQRERYWVDVPAANDVGRTAQGTAQGDEPDDARSRDADGDSVVPSERRGERLYGIAWRLKDHGVETAPVAPASSPSTWVLLLDRRGVGAALSTSLRARGDRVVLIVAGERYERLEPELYAVDPSKPESLSAALRDAFDGERSPRGIVHLWSLDATAPEDTTVETLAADRRLGTLSALHLAQALVRKGWRDAPRLWLVTRGAQVVGMEAAPASVSQAPLWGFGRSLALEHPELGCTRVDLSPACLPEEGEQLLRELSSSDGEGDIALRAEGRYVARLAPKPRSLAAAFAPASDRAIGGEALPVRADGAYLITGALGLAAAERLVARGARHLVLVEDRDAPNSEAVSFAARVFEQVGAEVRVLRADVAQRSEVQRVLIELDRHGPPLCGIVHTSEVVDDGLVLSLDAERCRRVMAPKVDGAWNLHALTLDRSLDLFVLYSSTASLLGYPGQSHGAAANAFLDTLAEHRRASGLCGLSINWGAVDVRQWVELYPSAAGAPFLSEVQREATRAGAVLRSARGASRFRETLAKSRIDERPALLEKHVRQQLARTLQQDASRISSHAPFRTLGLESVMAVELRNRLETSLGMKLPPTLLFTVSDVSSLTAYLLDELGMAALAGEERRLAPVGARVEEAAKEEDIMSMSDDRAEQLLLESIAIAGEDLLNE